MDLSLWEDSVLGVSSMSHPLVLPTPSMIDVNDSVHTSLAHPLTSHRVGRHGPWSTVRETNLTAGPIDHVVVFTTSLALEFCPCFLGLNFRSFLCIVFRLWVVDGVHTQDSMPPAVSQLPIAFVHEHGSLFYL